ncbi:oxysterol-binding protein (macronuclear) [Tetrahymena thermophila SB210]|uniref:Oxysterol-binding protein n=1 Tax=Tetrahymena thermophila (strain SB210) TaxID=312017 RepID=I7MJW4_TETTS|nr:oxysterol-binding protein [Tetrahymena thermophila SB210]EAS07563.1 oxysterol-binding protein [Tetrahymena thermophila SB210]|eukprot:XP_001027805.1 oxysterol-binding protein [Tetrahymena thermophila SB210]
MIQIDNNSESEGNIMENLEVKERITVSSSSQNSTRNSSMDKGTPSLNQEQEEVHNAFYNQINKLNTDETENKSEEISDTDLQKLYQVEEVVKEGVLQQLFSMSFNSIETRDQVLSLVKSWQAVKSQPNDESRTYDAHKEGGKKCFDTFLVSTLRSVAKEVIKQIGRKLISGDFNLTTISFPIRAMIPKSQLECQLYSTCYYPLFMNLASQSNDPLERMKLSITASISSFPIANQFYKPLNPILGETLEGSYPDGTQLFAEQVSHHPPITYIYVTGPQKKYVSYGYGEFDASAGLNSLKIKNNGKRFFKFQDGQLITFNQGYEYFSGTFFGTTRHETLGKIMFQDTKNEIECKIKFGKVKKRPTDFFEGEIKVKGKLCSKVYGSYLGFIEFDGVRYWDHRVQLPFKNNILKSKLGSDHSLRQDKIQLSQGNIKQAQIEKEKLEQIQRNDRKLRKQFEEKKKELLKKQEKEAKKKAKK